MSYDFNKIPVGMFSLYDTSQQAYDLDYFFFTSEHAAVSSSKMNSWIDKKGYSLL